MPLRSDTPNAKSRTRPSRVSVASGGNAFGGRAAWSAASVAYPTPSPSTPPVIDSNRFSVRNWRTSVTRPAPRAERTATSRPRASPPANPMLARLTQPMSSTRPAAAISNNSDCRSCGPTSTSPYRSTTTPQPLLESGKSRASRAAMVFICARACPSVTPAFSLAKDPIQWKFRVMFAGSKVSGVQICGKERSNALPSGSTPITVYESPSRRTVLPTRCRSDPNCDAHRAWLMTAT